MKVIDKQNREVLNEGRNYGLGFAFLKKTDDETYETVMPISPCKDYLNDVLYTEYTGNSCTACGLNVPKKMDIEDNGVFYMVIKIVGYQKKLGGNGKYKMMDCDFDSDVLQLRNNIVNVQKILNAVEDDMRIKHVVPTSTEIFVADDDMFVMKFDKFWCDQGYLISLYSLLTRIGMYYDGTNHYEDFMLNFPKQADAGMINAAYLKFKKILNGWLPNVPYNTWDIANKKGSPHGQGIQSIQLNLK